MGKACGSQQHGPSAGMYTEMVLPLEAKKYVKKFVS